MASFNKLTRRFISYVPSCPTPKYDTGCTFCEIPKFPTDKSIDYQTNLNNTKALPWKHIIHLSHGFNDFDQLPSKLEMVPGCFNEKITGMRRHLSPFHPVLMSTALLSNHEQFMSEHKGNAYDHLVMIYPDRKIVKFNDAYLEDFVKYYLRPQNQVIEEVYNPFKNPKVSEKKGSDKPVDTSVFQEHAIKRDVILTCGHTRRDIRCGLLAPLINSELQLVCEKEGLEMDIGLISHVGGHAYAGNLIYFPHDTSQNIVWYGRVFPDKIQGIISETVINGRIIQDIYRGEV